LQGYFQDFALAGSNGHQVTAQAEQTVVEGQTQGQPPGQQQGQQQQKDEKDQTDECYQRWPELKMSNPFYQVEPVAGAVSNSGQASLFGDERTTYAIMRIEGGTELPIDGGTETNEAMREFARDYGRSRESYGTEEGDQAGHIIAFNFGGSGETRRNIIPIDWNLNDIFARDPLYTESENRIALRVKQNNTVCFKISFDYESTTRKLRPSYITFEVMYRNKDAAADAPWIRGTFGFANGPSIP
jgi:hypothetical protein